VTGGYLDAYSGYKFDCDRLDESEERYCFTIDGNTISFEYPGGIRLGEVTTIVISDYFGHSCTKKFTYVIDPSNSHLLIFQEVET
jgi:hypothetical protein